MVYGRLRRTIFKFLQMRFQSQSDVFLNESQVVWKWLKSGLFASKKSVQFNRPRLKRDPRFF